MKNRAFSVPRLTGAVPGERMQITGGNVINLLQSCSFLEVVVLVLVVVFLVSVLVVIVVAVVIVVVLGSVGVFGLSRSDMRSSFLTTQSTTGQHSELTTQHSSIVGKLSNFVILREMCCDGKMKHF